MTGITEEITEKLQPKMCLIIYKSNRDNYYIEAHNIDEKGMGAAYPLTEDTLSDVVNYFHNHKKETYLKGAIPENMLYCNWGESNRIMVWKEPAQERMMYFSNDLGIPNGKAHQPQLIFKIQDYSLYVYVEDCGLFFRAPYHNVDAEGYVCLGSAKSKKSLPKTYQGVIDYYSNLFWNSEFSHISGNDSPIGGNLNSYWKDAIKSKKPFNATLIGYTKLNLKKLIDELP